MLCLSDCLLRVLTYWSPPGSQNLLVFGPWMIHRLWGASRMLRRALVSHFSSSCYPIYSLTPIYQPHHPQPCSTFHHIYFCVLHDRLHLQDTLLHPWSMPSPPPGMYFRFFERMEGPVLFPLVVCMFVSAFQQDIKLVHRREAMLDMANQP